MVGSSLFFIIFFPYFSTSNAIQNIRKDKFLNHVIKSRTSIILSQSNSLANRPPTTPELRFSQWKNQHLVSPSPNKLAC